MSKRDAILRATQDQQPNTFWNDKLGMWHQRPNGPLNRSQLKIVRIEHALLILGAPFYEAVKYAENECHGLSLKQAVYSYPFPSSKQRCSTKVYKVFFYHNGSWLVAYHDYEGIKPEYSTMKEAMKDVLTLKQEGVDVRKFKVEKV